VSVEYDAVACTVRFKVDGAPHGPPLSGVSSSVKLCVTMLNKAAVQLLRITTSSKNGIKL
jgi:hypothetical protein